VNEEIIVCPHCKREIPLSQAITHQVREQIRKETDQELQQQRGAIAEAEKSLREREKALQFSEKEMEQTLNRRLEGEREKLERDLKERFEGQFNSQFRDLANTVKEAQEKLKQAEDNEIDLRRHNRALEEKSKTVDVEIQRKVDEERKKMEAKFNDDANEMQKSISERIAKVDQKEKELTEAKKTAEAEFEKRLETEALHLEEQARVKAEASYGIELVDMRAQIQEKDQQLQKAQEAELRARKERRELEEAKKSFELEMNRKLDQERQQIRTEATKTLTEEFKLKELDKEKLVSDLKTQIEDLRRKVDQGSQESQGEVLEMELEDILKAAFHQDQIDPVPRGRKGADILHRVHNNRGQVCGTIIWESKRTKAWSDSWVQKLRDDQRESKAEIAAILTTTLPDAILNFGYYRNIWVTNRSSLIGLATALRTNLIQLAEASSAALGMNEKMEVIYRYLSGPAFRQRVEGIVEAFASMKQDLDSERRSITRMWAKREKEIERVITNTVSMYGDMQGIIGASLPKIKSLELKTSSSRPALAGHSAKDDESNR
jgi:hypothetical protein